MLRYTTLQNLILNSRLPINDRPRIVNTAIALALAMRLPLPTSEVQSVDQLFTQQHLQGVRDVVSGLNEEITMSPREVIDSVRRFFTFRYHYLFPDRSQFTDLRWDFFCSLGQVDVYFSDEEYQFLTANRKSIFSLAGELNRIIGSGRSSEPELVAAVPAY